MSFFDDLDPDLIAEISTEYKKAAYWLPFQAVEIKSVFDEDELNKLATFVKDMKDATDDNDRTAKIARHAVTVLKLLKLGKIIAPV